MLLTGRKESQPESPKVADAAHRSGFADAALKHRIPVIDRMMEVLALLERRDTASIRDLVAALKLPRTTVYRILNTLQLHDMVRRDESGSYQLGSRLLSLAAHVATGASTVDLVAVAQPFLDRLADELGRHQALGGRRRHDPRAGGGRGAPRICALGVARPAPADACRRLRQAAARPPAGERGSTKSWRVPWSPTRRAAHRPRRLRADLARIRRLGYAQDKGEGLPSVLAFAAPVFDTRGTVVAAISAPFLAGAEPSRMEEIRLATIAAATALTAAIPGTVAR